MEKWDQLTMVLKEHELMDLLDTIYKDLERVEELRKETKAVIMKAAMKWQEDNTSKQNDIVSYIVTQL